METTKLRKIMLKNEANLSPYACKDKDSIRLKPIDDDLRPNFFRDTDRIIHSLSYTRYIDKTQVFTHWHNDNISRRIIHVQLVAKIARTIGRALSLNEDLIEAIGLGHDLGHVPFGHPGERILNDISIKYLGEYFSHNVESVRELMYLENNGKGSNLSIQVLDGILCHNGEFVLGEYYPQQKTKEDFIHDYEECYKDIKHIDTLRPMTLEGCVVRISDMIAYLGRDIEDAIELKLLDINQIPESIKEILGDTNSSIIDSIVKDVIEHSLDKPYISMSNKVYQAIQDLKDFNYKYIYAPAMNEQERQEVKNMFNLLFETYLEDIKVQNTESGIYQDFINLMNDEYNKTTKDVRKVIDYIAGMTDSYMRKQNDLIKARKKTVR